MESYPDEFVFPFELIVVYCDNQRVVQVADNPIMTSKMKHVKIHAHYLR